MDYNILVVGFASFFCAMANFVFRNLKSRMRKIDASVFWWLAFFYFLTSVGVFIYNLSEAFESIDLGDNLDDTAAKIKQGVVYSLVLFGLFVGTIITAIVTNKKFRFEEKKKAIVDGFCNSI